MPRTFTLEAANALLVELRPQVEEMLRIRAQIIARQPEVWPALQRAAGNGGSLAASRLVSEFARLDSLVRHIQSLGVIVKDLNTGLLDFPALRDGREVYLCWRYGEAEIAFWHETDAGFSGRQPL
jgi:hypothetical protein